MSNIEILQAGGVIALIAEDGRALPGVVVKRDGVDFASRDAVMADGVHIAKVEGLGLQLPLGGEFDELIREQVIKRNGK